MVAPAAGKVALVRFPFSDLTSTKLRPAVVLAHAGRDDWVLCQITSNPYADPRAVELVDSDFAEGSLKRVSYARPGKLFTADGTLLLGSAGTLAPEAFDRIVAAIADMLEAAKRAVRAG